MLLALSSPHRASSIQRVNINFMEKKNSCNKFYFNKFRKSWRKGKAPSAVTYQVYTQDESLCVARKERWISGEEQFELWLSFIHRHKPVVSSTISGWLKLSS